MTTLEKFVLDLQYYLCRNNVQSSIIRIHSKQLEKSGDVSFPLSIKNWYQLINQTVQNEMNIFNYNFPNTNLDEQIEKLKISSMKWLIEIRKVAIIDTNVNVFLARTSSLYQNILREVLNENYAHSDCLVNVVKIRTIPYVRERIDDSINLTDLRLHIVKNITQNIISCVTKNKSEKTSTVTLTLNPISDNHAILCGPVLNNNGQKSTVNAKELYNKRASDMRMMAQHKYGVQIKPDSSWKIYFETLGKASVTIEMLSSKPRKPLKITLNDLQTANKGGSFIFYNCARLNALFKEFNKRVTSEVYPKLPDLENVDFSQLTQPEEWELFYVYVMQYPLVIKSCVKDIEKGILNPQNLIIFLSHFASLFSIYYRRIKILTVPRDHLYSTLYARIYLLKGIEYVFHHALSLLEIQPIKEM